MLRLKCRSEFVVCTRISRDFSVVENLLPSNKSGALFKGVKTMNENVWSSQLDSADRSAAMQWFAVYTVTRHEKRVAHLLNLRMIENFVPLYQKQCQWR